MKSSGFKTEHKCLYALCPFTKQHRRTRKLTKQSAYPERLPPTQIELWHDRISNIRASRLGEHLKPEGAQWRASI